MNVEALKDAGLGTSELLADLDARAVNDVDCEAGEVGHPALAEAMSTFCERWQVGVENLVADGEQMSRHLIDCAGQYLEIDQNLEAEFSRLRAELPGESA